MPPRRASSSRRSGVPTATAAATATAVALLGVLAATVLCAAPATAAPPYTLDERATAIAEPSLVFVEARLHGFLRTRSTGALVEAAPIDVLSRCTGFVVGSAGYVVTTTHCLQPSPDSLRGSAAYTAANDLIRDKKLTQAGKANFIKQTMGSADFTGATADTAPVTTVFGQLFVGTDGLTEAPAITGKVVDSQPTTAGDVALIKLDKDGLPVAQLGTTNLNPDSHVVEVGFGTTDANSATYTVQSRSSQVLARYGTDTPPRYKLDGDIGTTSNGGMVVDTNGHVVGMITADTASKDRTNLVVINTASISTLLATWKVSNTLAPLDRDYRSGLDDYFGGRYTAAIKKFGTVLAALPNDLLAQSYRKQAGDRFAIEGDDGSSTPIWAVAAAAAGGVALLAVIVLLIVMAVRRRGRRRAGESVPFTAYPPISGAPISAAPISAAPISAAPSSGAGTFGGQGSDLPDTSYSPIEGPPLFRAGMAPPPDLPELPGPVSAPPGTPDGDPAPPPLPPTRSWPALAPRRDLYRETPVPVESPDRIDPDDTPPKGWPVVTGPEETRPAPESKPTPPGGNGDRWVPPPSTP